MGIPSEQRRQRVSNRSSLMRGFHTERAAVTGPFRCLSRRVDPPNLAVAAPPSESACLLARRIRLLHFNCQPILGKHCVRLFMVSDVR